MLTRLKAKLYYSITGRFPDSFAVIFFYLRCFKKIPNLKNPSTFNEKIAWRKLYQRNPLFTVFCDKIAVKAEVERIIGKQHVIETLWVGKDPYDIPFNALMPPYVIKVNHSSGCNIFVRSKKDIDNAKIIKSLQEHLNLSHGQRFREWGYTRISPAILIERLIETPNNDFPTDYKFFVYHGRVHFIQVDFDRFTSHKRNLYTRDWVLLPAKLTYPNATEHVLPPPNLKEMIEIAEKIGRLFDFVRVDLYSTPKGILFGEATFYPGAGLERFSPNVWDFRFGEPWKIQY